MCHSSMAGMPGWLTEIRKEPAEKAAQRTSNYLLKPLYVVGIRSFIVGEGCSGRAGSGKVNWSVWHSNVFCIITKSGKKWKLC
jgi:hypothetical protein